jgi:TRAP-type C4-dicarboxylate transport system substrate-binding protein
MKRQKTVSMFVGIFLVLLSSVFVGASFVSAAGPIELKVATWNPPPPFPISATAVKWAKMVEEKSGGRVKITFFWAGGLASLRDTYRTVQTGVADIGFWLPGVLPGLHTLNEYSRLPLLGADSMMTATKVYLEMYKKFPELRAEFKGLRMIYASSMPPNQLHFTKAKEIHLPSDMKGIKLIGSASASDFINSTGAVLIFKPPSDYYMSLQKGLVEGAFQHWPFIDAFKLEELFVSHTNCGRGGFNLQMMGFWMNQGVWDKLPPEAQKAFDDSEDWLIHADIDVNEKLIDKAMASAREMGHEIVDLTPAEKEIWFKESEPIRQKWVEDMEAEGKPGKAVYQEALKLIKQYNQ